MTAPSGLGGLRTPSELAALFLALADGVEADEATTYTDEGLYAATQRLREVLGVQLRAADEIRGGGRRRRPGGGRRIRL